MITLATREPRGLFAGTISAALILALAADAPAQDADFLAVLKTQSYEQFSPLIVSLREGDFFDPEGAPFRFEVFAEASAPNALTSGTILPPGGPSFPLDLDSFGDELFVRASFENFSELNDAFGDGTYKLDLVGVNDGAKSVSLDLSGNTYAGVTRFTNFTAAQSINAGSDFTIQWEPIPGGAAGDFVVLFIDDEFGDCVFESPDIGDPGALDGTSTSVTVPGGTLSPSMQYYVELEIFKPVDSNEDYAPGVGAVSAYGKTILMPAATSGPVVDSDPPDLIRSVPFPFQSEVSLNSIVTLFFDEGMDTAVAPGQAITWSGVADPAQFAYSWSPDGGSLFCNYTPGLPASATIQWVLNPGGSVAKLRDAAGNNLPVGWSGEFETSATSNLGVPDVETFEVAKARLFYQDGPTADDLQSYFAGFFVDLSGISTVSSVDLGFPGGGVATNVGQSFFDQTDIEGEAGFAEKADLDRIFPNGDYVFTMHTAHDGDRSVTLTLGPDSYPNAPTIQDFAAAQAIDGSQPFTLRWDPMVGGTAADFIELILETDGVCYFETPVLGEPGALDGTATSVTIPAGILPPDRSIEGELVFARVTDTDSSTYPGVTGRAAFGSITEFEIETIGDPFQPELHVRRDGTQIIVTVIGEIGRQYELRESDDLGNLDPWTPVWSGHLFGDCDGFKSSFEFFDNVTGVPKRFYQARELSFGP